MTDHELDQLCAELREVPPPPALAARTLAAVARERRGTRRLWWAAPLALAAGALFFVWPEAPAPAPELVPKGVGEVVGSLDLRVAVARGDESARFNPDTRYAAGDVLHFRVSTSAPMTLTLSHDGVPIWTGPVPAGETDLPVAWALEGGESVFTVSGDGHERSITVTW